MKKGSKFFTFIIALALLLCIVAIVLVACDDGNINDGNNDDECDFSLRLLDDDTYEIVSYKGNSANVEIPDECFGKRITSIGGGAFSDYADLRTVTIGRYVTNIGANAFFNCTNLTSITIPDSVTSIGINTFEFCTALQKVTIGQNVASIGVNAFYNCANITEVHYLGDIKSWCEIEFNDNPLVYANYNDRGKAKLFINGVEIKGELNIPTDTDKIGNYAFYGLTGITSINIPDSVSSIGKRAFEGLTGITAISIPESVTSIGNWAFYGCSNLTAATGSAYALSFIPNKNLVTVTVTSGDIPDSEFVSCTNLQTVTLCEDVTNIGFAAFATCANLQTVTFGGNETSIEGYAFIDCPSLTEVIIPDSVTNIGKYAFSNCINLHTVTLGKNVSNIGEYAFQQCSSLLRVNYSGDIKGWCTIDFGNIYSNPFYEVNVVYHNTTKLYINGDTVPSDLNIPTGTTKISDYAFVGLADITSVTIPDSVTNIGKYAFSNCINLHTITLGKNVSNIGKYAFQQCRSLLRVNYSGDIKGWCAINFGNICSNPVHDDCYNRPDLTALYINGVEVTGNLIIPEGTTKISDFAFVEVSKITSVTIPDSVTSIGNKVFNGCSHRLNIYYCGTRAQWTDISIDFTNNNNNQIEDALIYFFSEQDPYANNTAVEGELYWHWNAYNAPEAWVRQN